MDDDDSGRDIPGVSQSWEGPRELVIILDGNELIRKSILGFRVEGGVQRCSDPDCVAHIMPDEIICVTALVAPPHEEPA